MSLQVTSGTLRLGYPVPYLFNPADHYIEVLAIEPEKEEECRAVIAKVTNAYNESSEGKSLAKFINVTLFLKHLKCWLKWSIKSKICTLKDSKCQRQNTGSTSLLGSLNSEAFSGEQP